MSTLSPPKAPPIPDWSRLVADSITQHGAWHTYLKLVEARGRYPDDLSRLGYTEILRNMIVRDFLHHPKGMQAMPKLTPEFLSNFDRFNLTAQEGYLVSLIDGRLDHPCGGRADRHVIVNAVVGQERLHPVPVPRGQRLPHPQDRILN